MGPLTVMASPSMTPTESAEGSSDYAVVLRKSATQKSTAAKADETARRWKGSDLEKVATQWHSRSLR
jgi:hypothetical protein